MGAEQETRENEKGNKQKQKHEQEKEHIRTNRKDSGKIRRT